MMTIIITIIILMIKKVSRKEQNCYSDMTKANFLTPSTSIFKSVGKEKRNLSRIFIFQSYINMK